MADALTTATHLAGQALRIGVYFGVARLLARTMPVPAPSPDVQPRKPTTGTRELLEDLSGLLRADAQNVRYGLYPPMADERSLGEWLARMRAMFQDAPAAFERRATRDAGTARAVSGAEELPDYYRQDFHFQTGGYLTRDSARLYDAQVETLFMGAAGPMRRAALAQVLRVVRGRDQRALDILDIACGTGRFLRQLRLALPAARLHGLDLSASYLDEARAHCAGLRAIDLIEGNAERLPFGDATLDAVSCIYLFHELPPEVRRTVTREIARVLRPGGHLVFMDSIQIGDHAEYDGLLEAFPVRFHEPYFRHYAIDDLEALFGDAGFAVCDVTRAFLSKIIVATKAA